MCRFVSGLDAMRFKGTIAEWNDDRGFGFIRPAEGGDRVFCHIKAFEERAKRPVLDLQVTYELASDDRGRPRARQIRYSSTVRRPTAKSAPASSSSGTTPAIIGACLFMTIVTILAVIGPLRWWVPVWYLALSTITFLAYGWDKVSARGGHWRTQESTLNGLALLGGWPGAWIAQHAWRHKSRKESFLAAFWAFVVMNLVALTVLVLSGGDPLRLLVDR
jgi:uncharacterized membrane protein YsdA (DUF1294 family)/cold shock CspA family protein